MHYVYESRFFISFEASVDICDIKFSNLLILTYIVASKKSTKIFYTAIYYKLQHKFHAA